MLPPHLINMKSLSDVFLGCICKGIADELIPSVMTPNQPKKFTRCEGTTAGQPLAICRRLGRTGDERGVGHVVLKNTYLVSRGRVDLIVLVIVSSLFFVAFSFIVLVIQRVYTVFHPVELFHRCH